MSAWTKVLHSILFRTHIIRSINSQPFYLNIKFNINFFLLYGLFSPNLPSNILIVTGSGDCKIHLDYSISGLVPLPLFRKKTTGYPSGLKKNGGVSPIPSWLPKEELISITTSELALSNGPNWPAASQPFHMRTGIGRFPKNCVLSEY